MNVLHIIVLKLICDSAITHHSNQGVEPFNFSGSGSVWIHQQFQISVQFRVRFR